MDKNIYIKTNDEADSEYKDLYAEYGIRMLKGSYEELLTYPPVKDYITNDSRNKDGVEYLINQKFDKKNVEIRFVLEAKPASFMPTEEEYISSYFSQLDAFLSKISSGVIYLKIPVMNKVFKLVYSSTASFKRTKFRYCTFTVVFVEINPKDRE